MNPVYYYHISLAIIQPARVQEIVRFMKETFPIEFGPTSDELIKQIHQRARAGGSVISVRRGKSIVLRTRRRRAESWTDDGPD